MGPVTDLSLVFLGQTNIDPRPNASDNGGGTYDLGFRTSDLPLRTNDLGSGTNDFPPRTSDPGHKNSDSGFGTSNHWPVINRLGFKTSGIGIRCRRGFGTRRFVCHKSVLCHNPLSHECVTMLLF